MDVQAQRNAGKHHLKKRARAQVSCGRQGVAHSMAARYSAPMFNHCPEKACIL